MLSEGSVQTQKPFKSGGIESRVMRVRWGSLSHLDLASQRLADASIYTSIEAFEDGIHKRRGGAMQLCR
jgi:hypothetical protein